MKQIILVLGLLILLPLSSCEVKDKVVPPVIEVPSTEEELEKALTFEELYPVEVDPKCIIPFDYLEMDGSTVVSIKDNEAFREFVLQNKGTVAYPYGITSFGDGTDSINKYHLNYENIIFPNSVEYFARFSFNYLGRVSDRIFELHFPNNAYSIAGNAFDNLANVQTLDLSNAKFISTASGTLMDVKTLILPANINILTKDYGYTLYTIDNKPGNGYTASHSTGKFSNTESFEKFIFRGNGEDYIIDKNHEDFEALNEYLTTDYIASGLPSIISKEVCYNSPVSEYPPNKNLTDVITSSIVEITSMKTNPDGSMIDIIVKPEAPFDYKSWYKENENILYPSVENYLELGYLDEDIINDESIVTKDDRFPDKCHSLNGDIIYCYIRTPDKEHIPIEETLPEDLTGYRDMFGELLIFDKNGYPIVDN